MSINVKALDPGIRDFVVWLNDHGFETTDSGDGVSKPAVGRCFEHPHVFCQTDPETLISEAKRLVDLLGQHGVKCGPVGRGSPFVEATFDPVDATAMIGIHHVTM